jgi:hypothetical protein
MQSSQNLNYNTSSAYSPNTSGYEDEEMYNNEQSVRVFQAGDLIHLFPDRKNTERNYGSDGKLRLVLSSEDAIKALMTSLWYP